MEVADSPARPGRQHAAGGDAAVSAADRHLLAKIEFLNPGGSVKDRIGAGHGRGRRAGRAACARAARSSSRRRATPASGLAIVAARRGYRCVFVMPDKMSREKIELLRAYGAEVVVCPTAVAPTTRESYYSRRRPARPRRSPAPSSPTSTTTRRTRPSHDAHHRARDLAPDRRADHALRRPASGPAARSPASGRYLKAQNPDVQIVGADPEGSVYSGGDGRPYLVEGIGEDFWPATFDAVGRRPRRAGQRPRLVPHRPPA